ncbi:hypothetical protein Hanom_Chr03g00265771 [Helianthus anomalus]
MLLMSWPTLPVRVFMTCCHVITSVCHVSTPSSFNTSNNLFRSYLKRHPMINQMMLIHS